MGGLGKWERTSITK